MSASNIEELLGEWKPFVESVEDWQTLANGLVPKATGCGPVFEFDENPIPGRPNESFAIADMREVDVAEPHYHPSGPNEETEIYIVMTGLGLCVVGGEEREIKKGSVIVTPPDTTHFTIPRDNLVLAVINTPPFRPKNYVVINESNPTLGFDKSQFDRLTDQA